MLHTIRLEIVSSLINKLEHHYDDDYMTAAFTRFDSDTEYYDRLVASSSSQGPPGQGCSSEGLDPSTKLVS